MSTKYSFISCWNFPTISLYFIVIQKQSPIQNFIAYYQTIFILQVDRTIFSCICLNCRNFPTICLYTWEDGLMAIIHFSNCALMLLEYSNDLFVIQNEKTKPFSCIFLNCWNIPMICIRYHRILLELGFYGPVNNEVMSSRSINSGTVPGQDVGSDCISS